MVERLVILASPSVAAGVRSRLTAAGGRVLAAYGARVWIVDIAPETEAALAGPGDPAVLGVFADAAPDIASELDDAEQIGVAAWNLRHSPAFQATRRTRRGDGRPWDDPDDEPEG